MAMLFPYTIQDGSLTLNLIIRPNLLRRLSLNIPNRLNN